MGISRPRVSQVVMQLLGASKFIKDKCAEIKLRAERRAGQLLAEQVRAGNPQLLHDETIGLKELGITRIQSHRWQMEASIPEKTEEAAAVVGVTQQTVDNWEKGVNDTNLCNIYTPPDKERNLLRQGGLWCQE